MVDVSDIGSGGGKCSASSPLCRAPGTVGEDNIRRLDPRSSVPMKVD